MADYSLLWQGIAEAALNYIVVSTKQTVSDVKTDLRTTKEDILIRRIIFKDNFPKI